MDRIKYYNGCLFHTVQKDFTAQTGDHRSWWGFNVQVRYFCTAMIWYLRVMYLKSPRGFIVMSHDRDERGVREKIRRTSPRGRRNTERKERDNREDEYTMWRVDEIEMMIVGVIEIIKERQERHTVEMGEKQGMGEGIDKGMGLFI
ncbi:putative peptidylprolyl isomerase [Arabidopsis thaliana]